MKSFLLLLLLSLLLLNLCCHGLSPPTNHNRLIGIRTVRHGSGDGQSIALDDGDNDDDGFQSSGWTEVSLNVEEESKTEQTTVGKLSWAEMAKKNAGEKPTGPATSQHQQTGVRLRAEHRRLLDEYKTGLTPSQFPNWSMEKSMLDEEENAKRRSSSFVGKPKRYFVGSSFEHILARHGKEFADQGILEKNLKKFIENTGNDDNLLGVLITDSQSFLSFYMIPNSQYPSINKQVTDIDDCLLLAIASLIESDGIHQVKTAYLTTVSTAARKIANNQRQRMAARRQNQ